MKRILIIGGNGAGKSTFSRALADKTGLPLYHLDKLYWYGDWQVTPREEFLEQVEAITQSSQWIIEGNNLRSLSCRLARADTVFWLTFSPARCVWNVICRELRYHGKARPDMPASCLSRLDPEFLKTVWHFNRKNNETIRKLLQAHPHLQVIRFTGYRQMKTFLDGLQPNMRKPL